jgi:hypothetical protein
MANPASSQVAAILNYPVRLLYCLIANRVLGSYVKELGPDDLKVNLTAGTAEAINLTLKEDALTSLHLPVAITEGVIENLTLSIPYTLSILTKLLGGGDVSTIQMQPIQLTLHRVRVVIKPLESLEVDEAVDEKKVRVVFAARAPARSGGRYACPVVCAGRRPMRLPARSSQRWMLRGELGWRSDAADGVSHKMTTRAALALVAALS